MGCDSTAQNISPKFLNKAPENLQLQGQTTLKTSLAYGSPLPATAARRLRRNHKKPNTKTHRTKTGLRCKEDGTVSSLSTNSWSERLRGGDLGLHRLTSFTARTHAHPHNQIPATPTPAFTPICNLEQCWPICQCTHTQAKTKQQNSIPGLCCGRLPVLMQPCYFGEWLSFGADFAQRGDGRVSSCNTVFE